MSTAECAYKDCLDPAETGCNLGNSLTECPHWKKAHSAAKGATGSAEGAPEKPDLHISSAIGKVQQLPWTGNTLGVVDLSLVNAQARASIVGVVGPYNAGKTSLLTLLYLLLQRDEQRDEWRFAGSNTLIGWENLAANLRWNPSEAGPKFPPHTSRGQGRRPGLLHLAIQAPTYDRKDFLITDPPGEWFSAWAKKEDAEAAEGARWVEQSADKFIFIVDREALTKADRGQYRDHIKDLGRRLAARLKGRPVAIVWTKSDKAISPAIEGNLKVFLETAFPGHATFNVQMRFKNEAVSVVEAPCVALTRWIVSDIPPAFAPKIEPEVVITEDLFLSYRGRRAS